MLVKTNEISRRLIRGELPCLPDSASLRGMKSLGLLSLAILPAGLAVAAEATNLLRNPGFEHGSEGWTLPNTFRVVDDVAHTGTRSLRLSNTNPSTCLLARQPVPFQPGLKYRYRAWIRTRGVKGDDSGATLCLEWSGA